MLVRSWLGALKSRVTRPPTRRRRRAAGLGGRSRHLHVESLEDRRLMAFDTAVSYPVGTFPNDVVVADFNNDGRLDLASANSSSDNVSVLLGNADGTFRAAIDSPTDPNPQSVAVGDFNADGKFDLATAQTNSVSVLLGDGSGGFAAPVTNYIEWGSPPSVAVGDFNSDGKLDLGAMVYYAWYGSGSATYIKVFLGNGDGSFTGLDKTYLNSGYDYSAVTADFNGDGQLDMAATNANGTVDVALGIGTGTFRNGVSYGAGDSPYALAAGDINRDGRADVVTTSINSDSVSVLLGDGLGALAPAGSYSVGSHPYSLALTDFNGDGELDVATGDSGLGTVSVLLGLGDGTLKGSAIADAGANPLGITVGDFDGDGAMDAAVANANPGTLSVLLNDSNWLSLDAPSLSISDVTVTEGNVGTVNATFTVSMSAPSSETVSVVYSTADNGATAGSDYVAETDTLTFLPGQTSQEVTIAVNGDRIYEGNERFFVKLTSAVNALLADGVGTGWITDDEPIMNIESDVSRPEGNTGTSEMVFTVTLSNPYDIEVTADFATADSSATAASGDYQATSGSVRLAIGQTTQTISIPVNGDRVGEYDEGFWVNLSNANYALLMNSRAFGTIVNDEPIVYFGDRASSPEGNKGTSEMVFTLTLSNPYDSRVTVGFATDDLTPDDEFWFGPAAKAGIDYTAVNGGVTFEIGQTKQTIKVPIIGDRLAEYDESFFLNLTYTIGALLKYSQSIATVENDEPQISISDVSKKEGNGKKTNVFTFTVTLSAAYDQPVTMSFRTADGSAKTSDNDYIAKTGTLTFAPGETTKTITIEVKCDNKKEANEWFGLDLFGNSSNSLFSKNRGIGTILNDD